MANQSVLELAVGTGKWDAGLKKAVTSLNNFTQASGGVQKALEQDSQKMTSFVQMMGRMESTAKSAKGRMNEYKNAITELTTQYRGLTEEEKRSSFGQALTQSIQQLTEKAGQARDAIADVNDAISHAASDTRVFDQISAGATFVTSSFQTLQGAAKLVGIEMGDNVQVIAKLQAAMAVTNGLTTIQNALQKQSALMQGLTAVQAKARLAAEAMATKGTVAATAAQKAFNAVANANPYVLLAAAVLGVAGAMSVFSSSTDEATEIEEEQISETEKLRQKHEEFAETIGSKVGGKVGEVVGKFTLLQSEWKQLKTVAEQKQWIDANQSAFHSLGLSVNSVNDAYQVFIAQAPQVIAALKTIAEAEANKELYKEAYQKREKIRYEAANTDIDKTFEHYYVGQEISENDQMWREVGSRNGVRATDKGWVITSQETADRANRLRANIARGAFRGQEQAAGREVDYYLNNYLRLSAEAEEAKAGIKWFSGGVGLGNYRSGRGIGGGHGTGKGTPKTEYELNSDKIKKLTDEYITASDARKTAIQGEIKALQDRNAEIDAMKDEALGKVTGNTNAYGSEAYFEKEISDLQAALKQATTKEDRAFIKESIDYMQSQLHELVGGMEEAIGLSGPSKGAMGDWMSYQNEQLDKAIIGSADYNAIAANILDTQMLQSLMEETAKNGIDLTEASEAIFEQLLNGENIPDETWQSLVDVINEKLEEAGIDPLALDFGSGSVGRGEKKESSFDKTMGKVSEGLNALSSISGGLQQMGIKVPEEVDKVISFGQGLLQVIEGVESIISLFQVSSTNANTVALAANTIAIGGLTTALIANTAINAIPFFSHGGLVRAALGTRVPGNHFSGDQVPALLNSGEVVLNQAQAGVVANKLQGGGINNLQLSTKVTAEEIKFVLNNNGRRTGRGEVAYSH